LWYEPHVGMTTLKTPYCGKTTRGYVHVKNTLLW